MIDVQQLFSGISPFCFSFSCWVRFFVCGGKEKKKNVGFCFYTIFFADILVMGNPSVLPLCKNRNAAISTSEFLLNLSVAGFELAQRPDRSFFRFHNLSFLPLLISTSSDAATFYGLAFAIETHRNNISATAFIHGFSTVTVEIAEPHSSELERTEKSSRRVSGYETRS